MKHNTRSALVLLLMLTGTILFLIGLFSERDYDIKIIYAVAGLLAMVFAIIVATIRSMWE